MIATFLAACGGGENSSATTPTIPTTSAAEKYVGTWLSDCDTFTERTRLVITKTSEKSLRIVGTTTDFGAANCASTNNPVVVLTVDATVSLVGTKTIGTDTVDTITAVATVTQTTDTTEPVGTVKNFQDVLKFSGNQLQTGDTDPAAPKDPSGFPTRLDPSQIYIKQ